MKTASATPTAQREPNRAATVRERTSKRSAPNHLATPRTDASRTRPRAILLLACTATWASSACKPLLANEPGQPKIHVEQRTVKVGRITEGSNATAVFRIENKGDADLFIDRVTASCGCTVPKKLTDEEKRVEPNEVLELIAVFNSRSRRGRQRKSVTVRSNDPYEPRLQLFLEVEVITMLDIQVKGRPAQRLSIGSVRPGQKIKDFVDILPTEPGKTFKPISLEVRHPALVFTTEPLRKDDRTGVRVNLRADPDAPIGQLVTSLRIAGHVGNVEVESGLAINGEVTGLISFRPLKLKPLQPVLPGNALRSVKLSSEGNAPFEILHITTDPVIQPKIVRTDPTNYTVELRIAESAPPGPFGSFLDIHTNLVEQPLIRIPVYASVRSRVELTPAAALLRATKINQTERTIKIESVNAGTLEISKIATDSPYLQATIVESTGRKSRSIKHFKISITGDPPQGMHTAIVRITTNVQAQPEVELPVTLLVD